MRTLRITPGTWLTVVLTAAVALLLWASFGLSRASASVPQWVLAVTLIALLLQLARELLVVPNALAQTGMQEADRRHKRAMAAVVWLAVLLLLTWLLGTAPGGALFCCAWLRWHAGEPWPVSLAIAAGLGIALWLLFTVLLGVVLYPGLL